MVSAYLSDEIENLRFHSALITSTLESIHSELLSARPVRKAGTFGKQFRHILDIRKCYPYAVELGVLDIHRIDVEHSIEKNKHSLLGELNRVLEEICSKISLSNNQQLEEK